MPVSRRRERKNTSLFLYFSALRRDLPSVRRSSMGAVASVEEKIRALRDRFIHGLAGRVAGIETELAQMAGNGSAMALERQFHTLAGTAGTYGLDRIAGLAADGEQICCDQIVDQ